MLRALVHPMIVLSSAKRLIMLHKNISIIAFAGLYISEASSENTVSKSKQGFESAVGFQECVIGQGRRDHLMGMRVVVVQQGFSVMHTLLCLCSSSWPDRCTKEHHPPCERNFRQRLCHEPLTYLADRSQVVPMTIAYQQGLLLDVKLLGKNQNRQTLMRSCPCLWNLQTVPSSRM